MTFKSVLLLVLATLLTLTTGQTASGVRGTYWAEQSDNGGCQVPLGSYTVVDAMALGQASTLGSLSYRPGLCGQVVDVQCEGGRRVQAVVASTCNLGSGSCGVDLIGKTWRATTGNKPPGVSRCVVSLVKTNPMKGSGTICYNRPNTPGSAYYKNLGVMNTGGEITASATLAGVAGRRSNGAWFDFNSGGRDLFKNSEVVTFTYESGKKVSFKLSECRQSSGVQIFR
ncbi:hypothetical protein DFJ77DRAFT_351259 [Powellomyces hirtus]|nr:hypothetical protein DFJ77DRAFT_351259 [Powellomyces hirtus]